MVCYVTLGANDIKRAAEFYQRLFDVIGARRVRDFETFVAWQQNETSPFFAVISPFNKKEATPGNGTMIAIRVESETVVDQIHKLALELGGINEVFLG
jgi:catechol 2,3-dioxygenase-like lactoylglutathione lyase family enzyme